jgi:hypothetical protein
LADPNPPQAQLKTLGEEFAELGRNIKQALQAAWASEDRQKLQAEIEAGLKEASQAVQQAADEFSRSQAGQTFKAEAEDFQKRVQSGELEAKIRSELQAALRIANQELKRAFPGDAPKGGKSA